MFDRRNIYILQRVKKNKVKLIFTRKVFNAFKLEQSLHRRFNDSNVSPSSWALMSGIYKIGIAKNVKTRLEDINESKLKSGHTEYFRLNWLEFVLLLLLIHFHIIKPVLFLIIITTILIIIALWKFNNY